MASGAREAGADRIELYTESYARAYEAGKADEVIKAFQYTAAEAHRVGLGINAGHDLDLHNLSYFARHIAHLDEVSIGHALVADALYFGWQNTIQLYQRQLGK
jgi:pyridoxine 5-phosphate synthase